MATTKKTTKKKTTKKKIPFSNAAKKGYVTAHVLIGVTEGGSVILHNPREEESMGDAIAELKDSFDYGEHYEVHHFTAVLPLARAPKVKKVRAKKVASGAREEFGISDATNPGAA